MYILRNYNWFLFPSRGSGFQWENLSNHRWPEDYDRLVKFNTHEEAATFLKAHPELENRFDAWIVQYDKEFWNGVVE